MSRVYGGEEMHLWEEKSLDGTLRFCFGVYGGVSGFCPPNGEEEDEDCDYDYDAFLDELQKHIADDDAVIIMEGGHEKLRYLFLLTSHKQEPHTGSKWLLFLRSYHNRACFLR